MRRSLPILVRAPVKASASEESMERQPPALAAPAIEPAHVALQVPPRLVFLFSGHMVDAPDRAEPRFPAEKEGIAARAIAAALDELGAGPGDLALAQAANGGDLLFLEACKARGLRLVLMLPFAEAEFIARSVCLHADGARWRARYLALRATLDDAPRILSATTCDEEETSRYERCNLWLLQTALTWGAHRLRFICLWNGAEGTGPGGTDHMVRAVRRYTDRITWLDTRTLW